MSRQQKNRAYRGRYETALTSRHLDQVLSKVLAKINQDHRQRPDLILAYWPQIVGSTIASLTKAESFCDGVLTVKVRNSTLYSLLVHEEKSKILTAIREKFPNVTLSDIKFKIG